MHTISLPFSAMKPSFRIRRVYSFSFLWASLLASFVIIALGGCGGQAMTRVEIKQQAQEFLFIANYERASVAYEELLEVTPSSHPEYAEVLYFSALSSWHRSPPSQQNMQLARSRFETIINDFPGSPYAPRALRNLGRMAEIRNFPGDVLDPESARVHYLRLLNEYPDSPLTWEAVIRIAGTYIQNYDNEELILQGLYGLEESLKDGNYTFTPVQRSIMWQYLAITYLEYLGDKKNFLRCNEQAESYGLVNDGQLNRYYLRSAKVAEAAGDFERALNYYKHCIDMFPPGGLRSSAKAKVREIQAILDNP